jgi:cytochrome c oxidase subunit 1
MSTTADTLPGESYLPARFNLWSWLTTTDHKRIGLLYLASITVFFFIAAVAIAVIRVELVTPKADVVSSGTYDKLFTIHGVIMVWFFLLPSIPATLGNFLMPLMIGARDMAFPRLNLASWYVYTLGGIFTITTMILGGVDTGWTFYTPYSSMFSNTHVVWVIVSVFIVGFSSIFTGINFIVTTHKMRAPGMTWFRLPLFVWTNYATSIILVLATPVLTMTLSLVAIERLLGVGIFDPSLGGDPLLFQHFFWFYSHPAVYIMILPAMGVASEIITCFARNTVFGYRSMVYAIMGIAVLGFMVWGHHMFVSGQSMYAGIVFSLLSFFVAVPSAIKVFNWTATLYKGSISFEAPMIYAFGFVGLFMLGGITGLFLASLALDVHLTDTYFVVAHFHYIMVGGAVMAYLGGIHFWWPKITGRLYHNGMARFTALLMFIGFNLTFFPQYLVGFLGMPRRYHTYPPEYQTLNIASSAGAVVLAVSYLLPLAYLLWSWRYGKPAGNNPWQASGLEWRTSSPPPKHNFNEIPLVTEGAYAYSTPASSTTDTPYAGTP